VDRIFSYALGILTKLGGGYRYRGGGYRYRGGENIWTQEEVLRDGENFVVRCFMIGTVLLTYVARISDQEVLDT